MEKGVLGIFGFTGAASAHTLKTYANLYKYPFISISPPTNNRYEQIRKKKSVFNEFENEFQEDERQLNSRDVENAVENENNYDPSNSKEMAAQKNSNFFESTNNSEVEDYQVNMFPDMIPLLVSLLKYNRWKSVYYFYNYQEGEMI